MRQPAAPARRRPRPARNCLHGRPRHFLVRVEACARPQRTIARCRMIFCRQLRRSFRRAGARAAPSCAAGDGRFRLAPSFFATCGERRVRVVPRRTPRRDPRCWVLSARTGSLCRCASSWASPRIVCKASSPITRQHDQEADDNTRTSLFTFHRARACWAARPADSTDK